MQFLPEYYEWYYEVLRGVSRDTTRYQEWYYATLRGATWYCEWYYESLPDTTRCFERHSSWHETLRYTVAPQERFSNTRRDDWLSVAEYEKA